MSAIVKSVGASEPIRVLLVDDHQSVLWGLEQLIDSAKPRMALVGKATTGDEALALLSDAQPDIILLDLDLGSETGTKSIPSLLERSQAKVLVLTGVRDIRQRDEAVVAGARGIVGKEEPPEELLKAIEKVHRGELWLDRLSASRILGTLADQHNKGEYESERAKISLLTARERLVIRHVLTDPAASNKAVASLLHISDGTLRNHLSSIYNKLGITNRLELLVYATKFKLLTASLPN
jgi:DNA-binding NarL/FixJ family response regulator